MSGHSKWSQIKRQKGVADVKRGQAFTKLANAIIIGVRQEKNPDPETNFKLRLLVEKAREANMPKENIQRAIERGMGTADGGDVLEEALYEGFGPEKVAVMVEVVTDNKQRTAASIKNIFEKGEGGLGVPGTVAYFFRKIGVIGVNKDKNDLDKIMLLAAESGAEDIAEKEGSFEIYTDPDKISAIKEELLKKGLTINSSELTFIPKNPILLSLEKADKVNRFISELEDLSEVQRVYTNHEEAKSENL